MDIGQSDNTYSKKTSTNEAGSTGLFKAGDYDDKPKDKTNNEQPGLLSQLTDTIKNEAQFIADKFNGTSTK
ncbi:hypothetical protein INT47_002905 [Mucor saturninus]|uniref:Uncharacterized protein n=1 Tax=Mucor saturninus TaxID=64648 RepID=A0A8H7URB1_9FUNG|nr:hypothetical protein INT47_002905 [Mucor saturninus]